MKRGAIFFIKCVLAMVVGFFFFAWITYILWNWLIPVLFAGPAITYWQALGLLVLTKILFFGLSGQRQCYPEGTGPQKHWKHRFYEKMSALSPEEKEAFKKKMRDKWCVPRDPDKES